ncbi:MAG: hypothetical protein L6R28_00080 [Planctomycetes bacterium]|nr:hypothetical protein [Planctomycetota bacterium]
MKRPTVRTAALPDASPLSARRRAKLLAGCAILEGTDLSVCVHPQWLALTLIASAWLTASAFFVG